MEKTKEINTFCSPVSQILSLPPFPPPFNYSLPSFFIIHLSSHLCVHVTLLFFNHNQRVGRGLSKTQNKTQFIMHTCKAELMLYHSCMLYHSKTQGRGTFPFTSVFLSSPSTDERHLSTGIHKLKCVINYS